jgi:hypothetical protein
MRKLSGSVRAYAIRPYRSGLTRHSNLDKTIVFKKKNIFGVFCRLGCNAVKLRKAPKGRVDTAQGNALGIQDKKP